jgi:hypothetical protein
MNTDDMKTAIVEDILENDDRDEIRRAVEAYVDGGGA